MPNNPTAAVPARTAEFTTADEDEVMLRYIQDGGQQSGTRQVAFYSWQHYKARQTQHGTEAYPAPAPFKPFTPNATQQNGICNKNCNKNCGNFNCKKAGQTKGQKAL